ncbi:MAG: S1 RNA-binding domain-containing protein, partial [Bacteroidia bacterium]
NAKNPLDNTAVHPERYTLLKKILANHKISLTDALNNLSLEKELNLQPYITTEVGLPTLKDILKELAKPGRDPREKAQEFSFDSRLNSIEDIQPGMTIPGIIGNVTNFGAFVNIGIKENGLVHISHLANKFVSNPAEVVKLNQQVMVKVLEVDLKRKRIQLSIKEAEQ